jgi:hypothetical protein
MSFCYLYIITVILCVIYCTIVTYYMHCKNEQVLCIYPTIIEVIWYNDNEQVLCIYPTIIEVIWYNGQVKGDLLIQVTA